MSAGAEKITVTVTEVVEVTKNVKRFKFVRKGGGLLPTFSAGAHTVVEMDDNGRRRLNPYSLMSSPVDRTAYTISVRRNDDGRGGSVYMHDNVHPGMDMTISNPVNLFSLDLRGKKHLMIAGGIGVTPFLAQIKQLSASRGQFELHYAVRSLESGAYSGELMELYPNNVNVYFRDKHQTIDLESLLDGQPLGTHIYVCGPSGMVEWVRETAEQAGWPDESIHYEEFLAPTSGKPFEVKLAVSDKVIQVGEQESLLDALEAANVDAPYLCRGGACGQCETNVIEYDGKFRHHDHWLSEEEQASGRKIMPCVSRFEGKTLVLDR